MSLNQNNFQQEDEENQIQDEQGQQVEEPENQDQFNEQPQSNSEEININVNDILNQEFQENQQQQEHQEDQNNNNINQDEQILDQLDQQNQLNPENDEDKLNNMSNIIKNLKENLQNHEDSHKKQNNEIEYQQYLAKNNIDPDNFQTQKQLFSNKNQQQSKNRWDHLYYSGLEKKQEKDKKIHQKLLQQQQQLDDNCIFQPVMETSYYTPVSARKGDIYSRQQEWSNIKQEKIQKLRREEQNKYISQCSFKPCIEESQQSKSPNATISPLQEKGKGVDKYLRRQMLAKQYKLQKELKYENPYYYADFKKDDGSQSLKQSVTVPKSFQFHHPENQYNQTGMFLKPSAPLLSEQKIESKIYDSTINSIRKDQYLEELTAYYGKYNTITSNMTYENAVKLLHDELHNLDI